MRRVAPCARLHRAECYRNISRNVRSWKRTVITPTPDGVSIATTSGRAEEGSLFGRAGLSGSSPSNPKEEAMAPAMPRNAPLTPIPVIASMITWEPERIQRRPAVVLRPLPRKNPWCILGFRRRDQVREHGLRRARTRRTPPRAGNVPRRSR